jgi:2-phospho-L-lactate guanylyltransferase
LIAALVPVKQLAQSKSRLLPQLSADEREALSLAMLRDVLDALGAAERIARRAVVTPDETVASVAEQAGAEAILYREPGLNGALEAGALALELARDDALLVVLGDVAGARANDLDALCRAVDETPGPCVGLAASSDGGTTALLRQPANAIPPHFGRESARRHREAAEAAGVPLLELTLPSLETDLDAVDDVRRFLARGEGSRGGGKHTRDLLLSLGWEAE